MFGRRSARTERHSKDSLGPIAAPIAVGVGPVEKKTAVAQAAVVVAVAAVVSIVAVWLHRRFDQPVAPLRFPFLSLWQGD